MIGRVSTIKLNLGDLLHTFGKTCADSVQLNPVIPRGLSSAHIDCWKCAAV